MYPQEYGRGPGFRHGPRGAFWLIPLVIGFALGALFFSGPRGPWMDHHRSGGYGRGGDGPGYRQGQVQSAPQAGTNQAPPQAGANQAPDQGNPAAPDDRHFYRGERGHRHGPHFGGFFPFFGGLRLLVPLLLIGTGLWLLSGRRRGPGHRGGPGQGGGPGHQGGPANWSGQSYQGGPQHQGYTNPAPTPSAPPASQKTEHPYDPPSTGETRIL